MRKFWVWHVVTIAVAVGLSSITYAETHRQTWNCLTGLISDLARTDNLVNSIIQHNNTLPNIAYLEAMWPHLSPEDPIIESRIIHPAAEHMRIWIKEISIQGEGLLIGIDGGLVAATEKTTDYWQGDENQFTQAIILNKGEVYIQKEVIDESTHLMLVKISAPVYKQNEAIGVLVIGLDQFVIDFVEPCSGLR